MPAGGRVSGRPLPNTGLAPNSPPPLQVRLMADQPEAAGGAGKPLRATAAAATADAPAAAEAAAADPAGGAPSPGPLLVLEEISAKARSVWVPVPQELLPFDEPERLRSLAELGFDPDQPPDPRFDDIARWDPSPVLTAHSLSAYSARHKA